MVKRAAFTLIELIIAIVVISIAILALPVMNQTNNAALESNIDQEAIFAASAKLLQVLTYNWDESSINPGALAKVVDTVGDPAYTVNPRPYRAGHVIQDLHRSAFFNVTLTSNSNALGSENGDLDDMDDFDGQITGLVTGGTSQSGYKTNYNARIDVTYVDDTPNNILSTAAAPGATSNLKMATITVLNGNNVIIVLRAFAANIGEIDYHKRSY